MADRRWHMGKEEGEPASACDRGLVEAWVRAAGDARVVAELEAIYAYVAAAVDDRRPVCTASGRCCRFEEWGHRLYVTGLETAYTLARLDAGMPGLDAGALARAREAGGCPFQVEKLCGVHAIRPLGCRIYYCDETAQDWQRELYERMMRELRAVHERHGIEYRYAEWRGMLGLFIESGGGAASASP